MSDAYVQVQLDGAGKKVQTFENTVNTLIVEAQAVVQVGATTGLPIAPALDSTVAGVAKDATVATGNASLASIDGKLSEALPLPATAANSAKQDTGNNSLGTLSVLQQVALMRSATQGFFAPEPQFFVGG